MTGIALDGTGLDELGAAYSFGVSLHGDFFADLDLIPKTGPIELRRKGDLVSNFSGPLFLTVNTAISWRPHSMIGMTPNSMGGWRFTDALRGLRVHLLWIGPVTRDMGEVPADLETYPVAKGQVLEGRYNMEVPVSDVPITDSLEIHILSPDGTQLGCINGHI
jgi:hypothetical protein